MRRIAAIAASFMLVINAASCAQDAVNGFVARQFTGTSGTTLPYRLFFPDAQAQGRPLPLIIYLHGSGGAGSDNLKQISGGNTNGTHVWTTLPMQARHPAFVLAPQLPNGDEWGALSARLSPHAELVIELLASLSGEFSLDADRIYLVGQSLGGFGTWDLITERPDLFAAAVPLCGWGEASRISAARNVPIWAFHGAKDQTVPVMRSRQMIEALRAAGSSAKYTEYPDAGHDVWTLAFAEPDLPEWLFAQTRAAR